MKKIAQLVLSKNYQIYFTLLYLHALRIHTQPPVTQPQESTDINRCFVFGNLAESVGKPTERIEADYAAVNQLINDIDAEVKVIKTPRNSSFSSKADMSADRL